MFVQKFVPAFAVIGAAMAQTSTNPCTETTVTINSQADADNLLSCTSVKGSIVIGTGVANDLTLNGPGAVSGNITCADAGNLISLSSSTITSIGGNFFLNNLTLLSTLNFQELTQVNTITWQALPALGFLTFPASIAKASSVTISNTFLTTLDGISLMTVGTLDINNNKRLTEFTSPIGNISNSLNIAANGASLSVSFPNLIWANDMTFRNISTLSFPSLTTVNQSLTFDESFVPSITSSNLTTIGNIGARTGALTIAGNSELTNVSFSGLQSVGGGLNVVNNTNLDTVSFPVLSQVGGAVSLAGNFTTPDLNGLKNVEGTLNVQSTATIDCKTIDSWEGNIVQGTVTCKSATSNPASSSGTSTSGGSGSGSGSGSGNKGAARASYTLDSRVIGLSVVGGLLGLLV